MSNPLERSILMALGAAAITREMAESIAGNLAQKGEETTALGREAVDEAVEMAKDETRSLRVRFDDTLQRNFRELGLALNTEVDELKLKVAQLEHRISLLEAQSEAPAAEPEKEE
ncbi:MAG: phasin family protein [Thermoleophilia bacterium]